jgi:nanoRNase/pAp phosphatase (c-di-AMP/oligoRNAs hydrolase)
MLEPGKKYRLVTRSDFDGLACAVLLKELDAIDDIKFVHPKDMQDGKVAVSDRDITTNLPYVAGVHLAFDHHSSETTRNQTIQANHIIDPDAPSAARVVYNYFGGIEKFPTIALDMMAAVDKADAAQFSEQDVLEPQGWELLSFLMDARTGLGRFKEFRVSNYNLMMELIDYCKDHSIDAILELPDVKERVELYFDQAEKFKAQIQSCATVHQNLVVLDLRQEETIYAGNRFMVYALFPQCNISIHQMWGLKKQNTVFAVGKSIFDRTSQTNIGDLMLTYGGGGHANAGTCQVDHDQAEQTLQALINQITTDG